MFFDICMYTVTTHTCITSTVMLLMHGLSGDRGARIYLVQDVPLSALSGSSALFLKSVQNSFGGTIVTCTLYMY